MPDYTLSKGAHNTPAEGRCALEWVAFIAGEPHTDHPVCVCPVLGEFGRSWNDALDGETRQKLRPYLARMIGTADDGRSRERAMMCLDWQIRTFTPAWLDLAGLKTEAAALRDLAEITDMDAAKAAAPVVRVAQEKARAARDAARDAAWDAARDAAWDAAGDAARAAARAAARDAAGDAAWDAAWDAAGDAAWDAARDAAWDALDPTVKALQASAFDLLDRMLPGEVIELPDVAVVRAREVCEIA